MRIVNLEPGWSQINPGQVRVLKMIGLSISTGFSFAKMPAPLLLAHKGTNAWTIQASLWKPSPDRSSSKTQTQEPQYLSNCPAVEQLVQQLHLLGIKELRISGLYHNCWMLLILIGLALDCGQPFSSNKKVPQKSGACRDKKTCFPVLQKGLTFAIVSVQNCWTAPL